MNETVAEITRLLTEAGHAPCVQRSRRKDAPPAAAGFRVLPSADGSIYVTWATGGAKPHEATGRERSDAAGHVSEYAGLLEAAGYQVKVEGTLWSTVRVLPGPAAAGFPLDVPGDQIAAEAADFARRLTEGGGRL